MKKIENISLKKRSNKIESIILRLKGKKKSLPTQYLYDDTGSKLFEEICDTEEYYLTRTEHKILNSYAFDIIKTSSAEELFEFGSGSSKKTKTLILSALKKNKYLTYFSFDIYSEALYMSYDELSKIIFSFLLDSFFKEIFSIFFIFLLYHNYLIFKYSINNV